MGSYSDLTLKLLFGGAGNECSFPGCTVQAVDTKLKRALCEICHIKGEKRGSARYDPFQSPAERNDYANLIVLCSHHHHAVVDLDPETYTVEKLLKMTDWPPQ